MIFKRFLIALAANVLLGCAAFVTHTSPPDSFYSAKIQQLLPADALLLGEQHDAPDHQRLHLLTVKALIAQQNLAALALEMASAGQSTEKLSPEATDTQVRESLQWKNDSWPWATYGPIVMTAVRAGVPVVGANIVATGMKDIMRNTRFDTLLGGPALKAQQQNIRSGHCKMLPESQISPMTRIQIARDVSMADTLVKLAIPGKTVLLLAGRGHVDRLLGVAQHLPPGFKAKTVLLGATLELDATEDIASFDQTWPAQPAPEVDYCANFSASRSPPAATSTPSQAP